MVEDSRYLIVSLSGRTGSTLITALLNEYYCHKFQSMDDMFFEQTYPTRNSIPTDLPNNKFIFKIHQLDLFSYLRKHEDLVLIHSTRNYFNQMISLYVSKKTNIWSTPAMRFDDNQYKSLVSFDIQPEEFFRRIDQVRRSDDNFSDITKMYNVYSIDYDSISNNYNKVYEILNIDFRLNQNYRPFIKKTPVNYRDFIINYDELNETYTKLYQ
jgi:hypothetical protein